MCPLSHCFRSILRKVRATRRLIPCDVEFGKDDGPRSFLISRATDFKSSIDVIASYYKDVLAGKEVNMAVIDIKQLADQSTGDLRSGMFGKVTPLQKLRRPSEQLQKALNGTQTQSGNSQHIGEDTGECGDSDLIEGANFLQEDVEMNGILADDDHDDHDASSNDIQKLFEQLDVGGSALEAVDDEAADAGDSGAGNESSGSAQWIQQSNNITDQASTSELDILKSTTSKGSDWIGDQVEEKAVASLTKNMFLLLFDNLT